MEFNEIEKKLQESYVRAKEEIKKFDLVQSLLERNKGILTLELNNGTVIQGLVKEVKNNMSFDSGKFTFSIVIYTEGLSKWKTYEGSEIKKIY